MRCYTDMMPIRKGRQKYETIFLSAFSYWLLCALLLIDYYLATLFSRCFHALITRLLFPKKDGFIAYYAWYRILIWYEMPVVVCFRIDVSEAFYLLHEIITHIEFGAIDDA